MIYISLAALASQRTPPAKALKARHATFVAEGTALAALKVVSTQF